MNEAIYLLLAVLGGLALGAFFFSGLWWTVQRGLVATQPALLILGSFLLRTAVVVAGFYLAVQGGWQSLAACMGGFLVARMLVTRIVGAQVSKAVKPVQRISS
jgi:F1F0 ATPase subunit 2